MNKLIGITGGMSSGKTTLCKKLIELNPDYIYIDVDDFRRSLYKNNEYIQELKSKIIELKQYKIDLLMIILGAILYAMAGVYSTALVTMRKNNVQLLIYLIDSVIGVVVSYFLVMSYGIHGAVAGYTITMIPHIVLYRGYFEKEYHKWKNEKER